MYVNSILNSSSILRNEEHTKNSLWASDKVSACFRRSLANRGTDSLAKPLKNVLIRYDKHFRRPKRFNHLDIALQKLPAQV